MIPLAVISTDAAELRVAQSKCLLQHRVEDRPEITRRAVNDLQDLGSRGLLFERLARLGDEPRVLDRNDGLGGEEGGGTVALLVVRHGLAAALLDRQSRLGTV